MRRAAVVAIVVGALGSWAFMLRAGTETPRLLLVGFLGWIAMPFAAAAWALRRSPRWAPLPRAALGLATVVVALVSLVAYGGLLPRPPGAARAFWFVATAPVTLALLILAVAVATFVERRRVPGAGASR